MTATPVAAAMTANSALRLAERERWRNTRITARPPATAIPAATASVDARLRRKAATITATTSRGGVSRRIRTTIGTGK